MENVNATYVIWDDQKEFSQLLLKIGTYYIGTHNLFLIPNSFYQLEVSVFPFSDIQKERWVKLEEYA